MAKAFASEAHLAAKQVTFRRLSPSGWAFTAEGDPNTGVIVGDDAVMVIDAQATPLLARDVRRRIRVTCKPIRYALLTAITPFVCSAGPFIGPSTSLQAKPPAR
jgi:hypothetical protein